MNAALKAFCLAVVAGVTFSRSAAASTIARAENATIVASGESLLLVREGAALRLAAIEGEAQIVVDSRGAFAVIDRDGKRARFFGDDARAGGTLELSEPAVEPLLHHGILYFLSKATPTLIAATPKGELARVVVGSDAALLRASADELMVVDRIAGRLQVYAQETLQQKRSVAIPKFASDLEADERYAYLSYPRSARLAVIERSSGTIVSQPAVGAVPVDIALRGNATVTSAGEILVADPSSKRLWREERQQSVGAAFGRGFVKGLIGLGLYRPSSNEFPTGVDRVVAAGKTIWAYDTSSQTLYRVEKRGARRVLSDVAYEDFCVDSDAAYVWNREGSKVHVIR